MKKGEWIRSIWLKAPAFILAVALVPIITLSLLALWFGYDCGWWTEQPASFYDTPIIKSAVQQYTWYVWDEYESNDLTLTDDMYYTHTNATNFRFAFYDKTGNKIFDNLSEDGIPVYTTRTFSDANGRIEGGIAKELTVRDQIYWAVWGTWHLIVVWNYTYIVLPVALILFLFLLIYLTCVSGRRPGTDNVIAGWQERIPFDLYIAAVVTGISIVAVIAIELTYQNMLNELPLFLICYAGLLILASILLLGFWMTLCTRIKLGEWWKGTVIFWLLNICRRILIWLFRALKAAAAWCLYAISVTPLVWKTLLILAALCVIELIGIINCTYDIENMLVFWIIEKLILVPIIILCAFQLRKLQSAGKELAAGNLGAKVDLKRMFWDFKKHGENLNDISYGMQAAVDKQLKSERLKTELITNVSHDIKTPLTSIINYVDLLKKDPHGRQASEYLDVLDRQSHRLKKLTEDLIEVSKASTGNMEVNASRFNVKELLKQALGEYSDKMEKANIETVLTLPEHDLFAWADGTLLWRVLDNIFSNTCKYAQPGTRFYIDAGKSGDQVKLSFKNISRVQLNVSSDELMERFVRGSSARDGEGSGLGLNIAKSLIELQGGTFNLTIDGDLFRIDITLCESGH